MDQMVANRLNRWIDLGLGLVLMIFDVLFSSLSLLRRRRSRSKKKEARLFHPSLRDPSGEISRSSVFSPEKGEKDATSGGISSLKV